MPSKRRKWKFRIRHILDAIAECQQFVEGISYEDFLSDPKTQKAVTWNIMVIGEAAQHVPMEIEAAYPQLPWPQMRGIRHHIVHGYDQVDLKIVWNVVQVELPPLVPVLEKIFKEAPE